MDPRDVELVAAALQQGDVPRLGTAQAKRDGALGVLEDPT
jgi:hypothetical protein